jgi:hypothetical protein
MMIYETTTIMQDQEDFTAILSTLMESVEKFQAGESGEGNYLVAMNCLRSLHGFKHKISNNGDGEGRLRDLIDDYEVDLRSLRSEVLQLEGEIEEMNEWKCAMSVFHDEPEWCKRCGSWAQKEEKIRATETYGCLCLSCRDDLCCLFPEEEEEARIESERREAYMKERERPE